jgi:DnaJ-domain-containing protein 1
VGIGKRFWEVARANASDFASAFSLDPEVRERRRVDDEIEAQVAKETAGSVGARAGRSARHAADRAEQAWERAFEEARARGGVSSGDRPTEAQIEGWYRTLEVPVGAEFKVIRKSYRRLLSKYHPDKFAGDPEKYAAATEVARKITMAFNGIKTMREG